MKSFRSLCLIAIASVASAAACTVGDVTGSQEPGGSDQPSGTDGSGGTGGGSEPGGSGQPGIALSTPAAATTKLGTTLEIPIEVSGNGLSGSITLAATGVPAGWTANVVPATVSASDATEVHLVVQVPSNATASAYELGVSATSGGVTKAVVAPVSVQNQLDLSIASGGVHTFTGLVRVKVGAQLLIKNNDGTTHQVHASSPLAHQGAPMAQGATYTQTPTAAGQVTIYCHIHGQGTGALNVIVE